MAGVLHGSDHYSGVGSGGDQRDYRSRRCSGESERSVRSVPRDDTFDGLSGFVRMLTSACLNSPPRSSCSAIRSFAYAKTERRKAGSRTALARVRSIAVICDRAALTTSSPASCRLSADRNIAARRSPAVREDRSDVAARNGSTSIVIADLSIGGSARLRPAFNHTC